MRLEEEENYTISYDITILVNQTPKTPHYTFLLSDAYTVIVEPKSMQKTRNVDTCGNEVGVQGFRLRKRVPGMRFEL